MYSIIPITSKPRNTFSCKIPVDGKNVTLVFTTRYNEIAGYWNVTVSDTNGLILINNLPMLPGQNILEQYSYLEIGSACIIPAHQMEDEYPNAENLGGDWLLVWSDMA